ncbi:L,D-transpeptidase [Acidithiobacillus sp. AMEEHan]|uniref:L,D-transpeptidase n=1 Tax=Acidithiobacillus sp. AMEEHan TaxID=2994951 RepID=UPI0027E44867|nr:L,D-transpeptidase [Acidithiobacillus sp. AMEEHan]
MSSPSPSLPAEAPDHWLWVQPARQRLLEMWGGAATLEWPVSTARAGLGEELGSGKTPRGWHYVRARVGDGLPADAVLRGRRWRGERWQPGAVLIDPILARLLWLCGLEPGRNRGGQVDTFRRYIYLHGTADVEHLGQPVSAGCIRLDPAAIIDLFSRSPAGLPVLIADTFASYPRPNRRT